MVIVMVKSITSSIISVVSPFTVTCTAVAFTTEQPRMPLKIEEFYTAKQLPPIDCMLDSENTTAFWKGM